LKETEENVFYIGYLLNVDVRITF